MLPSPMFKLAIYLKLLLDYLNFGDDVLICPDCLTNAITSYKSVIVYPLIGN